MLLPEFFLFLFGLLIEKVSHYWTRVLNKQSEKAFKIFLSFKGGGD